VLGLAALTTSDGAPVQRLRIVGSDLLSPSFAKALEQHATENGYLVEHAFDGSRAGLEVPVTAFGETSVLVGAQRRFRFRRMFGQMRAGVFQPIFFPILFCGCSA